MKQIVGSTLLQDESKLVTNFVAERSSADFASQYKKHNLTGGHIIMLGGGCEDAARAACAAYPGGLQVGGGLNDKTAKT